MIVQPYIKQLTDETQQTIVMGSHTFVLNLVWNESCQEQYDALTQYLTQLSNSDPLYNTETNTFEKDYDYCDWYTTVDLSDLDSLTILPYSLYKTDDKVTLATSRYYKCLDWQETLQIWEDTLHWRFSLSENNNIVMTGSIYRQSCYTLSDSNIFFFISNLDTIGINDLTQVYFLYLEYLLDE